MSRRLLFTAICVLMAPGAALLSQNDTAGKTYTDYRGKRVYLPLGDRAFADEVIGYVRGNPPAREEYAHPDRALGTPDFVMQQIGEQDPNCTSLGCGGTLTLRFIDNALTDQEGPDLYVFEVGTSIESTDLEISTDGKKWIKVGKISGGTAGLDIAKFVKPGQLFRYVRLTDLKSDCNGTPPGADIDAVAAIGSARQLEVARAILFDYNKATLTDESRSTLEQIATELKNYPDARISIEGHTDSVGADDYNLRLSERRAQAVRDYLVGRGGISRGSIAIGARGETQPIASNDDEAGRTRNRRVEILVTGGQ